VLRHRLVLSYEALSDEVTADAIITKALERIPLPPKVVSREMARRAANA